MNKIDLTIHFQNTANFMRDLRNIIFSIFILSVLSLLLFSCSNVCTYQMTENRSVKLGFFQIKASKILDTTVKNVFIYIRNDTMFYKGKDPASKVSLELDQNNDSSVFYFKTDSLKSKVIDTLIFTYQTQLQLISSECGFNTVYSSLNFKHCTYNIIDSVIRVTTDVNSDVNINYKLILRAKHK
jgi:hypothetical protein